MKLWELLLIALALSMDAFAVAVCKGLSLSIPDNKSALIVGGYFGFFQGFMPLIGFFLGSRFSAKIVAYDHWIAFVLLAIIGGKMIKESRGGSGLGDYCDLTPTAMLPLAIATSIDALVVGLTLALLDVNIIWAAVFIGLITFMMSALGVKIGNVFGAAFRKKAEFAGGVVLVLIGFKVLVEHLLHP